MRGREIVVGATFTGPDVAELLHATIAVVGEVSIARLRHAVPSSPTRSEVWLRLLETSPRPPPEHNGNVRGRLQAAGVAGIGLGIYALLVRGALTVDLGVGRRVRPLGPLTWHIAAPRELVFEVISAPYLGRTPRALESKLRVLERGEGIVLAEHYTPVGPFMTTTLETVRFEPPERVHFRLVRGPVPHVVEQFRLRESDGGTELEYSGELGADLWALGRLWSAAVARIWEETVRGSLAAVKDEAERRAAASRARKGMSA